MTQTMTDPQTPTPFWGDTVAPGTAPELDAPTVAQPTRRSRKPWLIGLGVVVTLGALVAGGLLVQGQHDAGRAPAPVASHVATAAATPAATPDASAPAVDPSAGQPLAETAVKVGDKLTTAAQQNAAASAGLSTYTDDDGNEWAISVSQPLPGVVKAAMAASVAPQVKVAGKGQANLAPFAQAFSAQTGREVVLVYAIWGANSRDAAPSWIYGGVSDVQVNTFAVTKAPTLDGAVANVQKWIATQPNPARFDVVEVPNPNV